MNAATLPAQPLDLDEVLATMRGFAIAGCDRVANEARVVNTNFYIQNSSHIETDAATVRAKLKDESSAAASHDLYPLPFSNSNELLIAFFRPKFFFSKSCLQIELALVSAKADESWGYRLEFGNRGDDDVHGYDHLQLTGNLKAGAVKTSIPSHFSYNVPAFPTSKRAQFSTWLATLIAITGASKSGKGLLAQFEVHKSFFDVDVNAIRVNLKAAIEVTVSR